MGDTLILQLINEAKKIANQNFCCKHSSFTVGAALLTFDGKIYTGFNVENDGIQSICAERVTLCKALTENNRDFKAIAIVGKKIDASSFLKTLPCGYCRQFIKEYTNKDFEIYTCDDEMGKIYKYTIEELLPESFNL